MRVHRSRFGLRPSPNRRPLRCRKPGYSCTTGFWYPSTDGCARNSQRMQALVRRLDALLGYRLWAALCLTFLWVRAVSAESPNLTLALPRMEPCLQSTRPMLPAKWRGVFLMIPFTPTQLVVGEMIYDAALPAMQVKLYGVRSGAANFLVLN